MNRLVIDANIFVKLFHEEADSAAAEHLLDRCLAANTEILVPSIFMYEVLYVAEKRGKDARTIAHHIAAQPIQHHALSGELTAKTLDIIDTARGSAGGGALVLRCKLSRLGHPQQLRLYHRRHQALRQNLRAWPY